MRKQFLVFAAIFLLAPQAGYSDDAIATFGGQVLNLPAVILPADNRYYQNIRMQLAADGRWDLIQIEEANLATVELVEVQVLESLNP